MWGSQAGISTGDLGFPGGIGSHKCDLPLQWLRAAASASMELCSLHPSCGSSPGNGNCGCSTPGTIHACLINIQFPAFLKFFFFFKPINSYKVSKGERIINTDGKSLNCQIPPRAISAAAELSRLLLTPLYFCDKGNLMAN